ncbi:hypothetical protein [Mycobacteroides abscessus]|uniref:hypothetical protein n=1 Tax=Mycobacteroides abscessus TaxID=36809 RepID=UPI00092C6FE9|nr:hypothetical protein [Mycobacteroides abscessus]SIC59716.1 Uncharacterised protein [Mycobacteroides abscessus subsp. abscessus]
MSKLDDILNNNKQAKEQVKNLMKELIGYGSVAADIDTSKLSAIEKAEWVGRNELSIELREKVEAL